MKITYLCAVSVWVFKCAFVHVSELLGSLINHESKVQILFCPS